MNKKKAISICILLALLLLLSSCSQSKKFTYDNSVNWNTTASDILKKYGTPTSTEETELQEGHKGTLFIYENVKCFEFDGFKRVFGTLDNDNKVCIIGVGADTTPVLSRVYAEGIYNSLIKTYGKPAKEFLLDENWSNGSSYWTLDDTIISLQWSSTTELDASSYGSVSVQYIRKEGSGLEEMFN